MLQNLSLSLSLCQCFQLGTVNRKSDCFGKLVVVYRRSCRSWKPFYPDNAHTLSSQSTSVLSERNQIYSDSQILSQILSHERQISVRGFAGATYWLQYTSGRRTLWKWQLSLPISYQKSFTLMLLPFGAGFCDHFFGLKLLVCFYKKFSGAGVKQTLEDQKSKACTLESRLAQIF